MSFRQILNVRQHSAMDAVDDVQVWRSQVFAGAGADSSQSPGLEPGIVRLAANQTSGYHFNPPVLGRGYFGLLLKMRAGNGVAV
jgi:hypothetical protein